MFNQKLCLLLTVVVGLAMSSASYASVDSPYKLISAEVVGDGAAILKTYAVKGPIKVSYEYGLDEMGVHDYSLGLRIVSNSDTLVPVSLDESFLAAGGDNDPIVKSFGIRDVPKGECRYYGNAVVKVKKITKWEPEFPAGADTDLDILRVISSTPPKLKCD